MDRQRPARFPRTCGLRLLYSPPALEPVGAWCDPPEGRVICPRTHTGNRGLQKNETHRDCTVCGGLCPLDKSTGFARPAGGAAHLPPAHQTPFFRARTRGERVTGLAAYLRNLQVDPRRGRRAAFSTAEAWWYWPASKGPAIGAWFPALSRGVTRCRSTRRRRSQRRKTPSALETFLRAIPAGQSRA